MDYIPYKVNRHVLRAVNILSEYCSSNCGNFDYGVNLQTIFAQIRYQMRNVLPMPDLENIVKQSLKLLLRAGLVVNVGPERYAVSQLAKAAAEESNNLQQLEQLSLSCDAESLSSSAFKLPQFKHFAAALNEEKRSESTVQTGSAISYQLKQKPAIKRDFSALGTEIDLTDSLFNAFKVNMNMASPFESKRPRCTEYAISNDEPSSTSEMQRTSSDSVATEMCECSFKKSVTDSMHSSSSNDSNHMLYNMILRRMNTLINKISSLHNALESEESLIRKTSASNQTGLGSKKIPKIKKLKSKPVQKKKKASHQLLRAKISNPLKSRKPSIESVLKANEKKLIQCYPFLFNDNVPAPTAPISNVFAEQTSKTADASDDVNTEESCKKMQSQSESGEVLDDAT